MQNYVEENRNVSNVSLEKGFRRVIQDSSATSEYGREQYSADTISNRFETKDDGISSVANETLGREQDERHGNTNNERSIENKQGTGTDGLSGNF